MGEHVYDLEQDVPDGAYVSFPVFMFGKPFSSKYFNDPDSLTPLWTQLSKKSRSKGGDVIYHVKCHAEPSLWEFQASSHLDFSIPEPREYRLNPYTEQVGLAKKEDPATISEPATRKILKRKKIPDDFIEDLADAKKG